MIKQITGTSRDIYYLCSSGYPVENNQNSLKNIEKKSKILKKKPKYSSVFVKKLRRDRKIMRILLQNHTKFGFDLEKHPAAAGVYE